MPTSLTAGHASGGPALVQVGWHWPWLGVGVGVGVGVGLGVGVGVGVPGSCRSGVRTR